MPAINLPTINITDKDFKSKETMENILDTLMKYRKELNYLLMNLDLDNMPAIGGLIGDIKGDYSLLSQTVNGITMQVGNIQGDVSSLQIQANGIIADVRDNAGNIANLAITAQGLQSQVTNNAGNISTLTQTASGLQSQVSSINTTLGSQSSQIIQLSNSISSKVSQTDYNGVNIVSLIEQTASSIKLSASKIDLMGITTMYSPTFPTKTYLTVYGNGFALYENSIKRFDVWHDGFATQLQAGVLRFSGNIEFDNANVSGFALRFA